MLARKRICESARSRSFLPTNTLCFRLFLHVSVSWRTDSGDRSRSRHSGEGDAGERVRVLPPAEGPLASGGNRARKIPTYTAEKPVHESMLVGHTHLPPSKGQESIGPPLGGGCHRSDAFLWLRERQATRTFRSTISNPSIEVSTFFRSQKSIDRCPRRSIR